MPIILETTHGYKHQIVIGGKTLLVGGLRMEEVGGLEIKVAMGGDWRQIGSTRTDACVGIKAESVIGSAKETISAGEQKDIPALRQDTNPSQVNKKSPLYEKLSVQVVNDFKSQATLAYAQAKQKAATAKFLIEEVHKAQIGYWEQEVGKYKKQIDEYKAKITDMETTCTNYKIKSSKFVKMIASASIKLSVGKVSGKVSSQVSALASSLAEFKGEIKLAG